MLVVNLFGAPSVGKTTLAMLIASELKTKHSDLTVECPDEVAKLIVYDDASKALKCQIYVAGKQFWQVARCEGHADIVVCDSPILMSHLYGFANDPVSFPAATFFRVCEYYHEQFPSINVLVNSKNKFEEKARAHSKEQSDALQHKIQMMMDVSFGHYYTASPTREDAEELAYIAACTAWQLKDKQNAA